MSFVKNILWSWLAGLVLLGGPGPCRAEGNAGASLRISSHAYLEDETLTAERCIIEENAYVRVLKGAHLTVLCKTLIIEGTAEFDGRGEAQSRLRRTWPGSSLTQPGARRRSRRRGHRAPRP